MPTVSCGFENQPRQLSGRGATLYVEIGYDANFRPGDDTRPDLSLAQFEALIDTGAAATCVDEELATWLRLPELGQEEVAAALGSGKTTIYAAQIYAHELEYTFTGRVPGVRLVAGGQPHSVIIGRDFLRHFRLTYDGRTGAVTLSND